MTSLKRKVPRESRFRNVNDSDKNTIKYLMQSPGILTSYMGKPEVPVGKSNGSRHSVWEPPENMGCDLQRCNFSTLLLRSSDYWIASRHAQL